MESYSISPVSSESSQSCTEETDNSISYLDVNNKRRNYCGVSLDELYYGNSPWNYYISPLNHSKHHTVLFQLPVNLHVVPQPHCSYKSSIWDSNHVKMPFDPNNVFPIKKNNENILQSRWTIIQQSLSDPIRNSYELEAAIQSYNLNLRRTKFHALHHLFEVEFNEDQSREFFNTLLPKISKLALRIPELIKSPIPILKEGKPHTISLSQLQIASILANAFFCTFPMKKDAANIPGVNFYGLYECEMDSESSQSILEKLKCLIHYFKKVCKKEPVGVLTFEKKHLPRMQFPRWDKVETRIANIKLHITSDGTIEEGGKGMLQVDFANCFVGGGVLYMGCVQEEIRFVICPELIVSRLFTEKLAANEALLIIGAECYSDYTGYACSFKWKKNHEDRTPYDPYGRKRTSIIAIDALPYFKSSVQYSPSKIIRELNKAYVGFCENSTNSNVVLAPIATGNWGCGAFNGNLHLKAIIQIMACTTANRNIAYFTFGDKKLQYAIFNIYHFFAKNNVTVGQIWKYLCRFYEAKIAKHQLLAFLKQSHIDTVNKEENEVIKKKSQNEEKIKKSSLNTLNNQYNLNNQPSTSKIETHFQNSDSDEDVIETSQDDLDVSTKIKHKKDSLSTPIKPLIKNTTNIKKINQWFSSDEETEQVENGGFLLHLDNLVNPSSSKNCKINTNELLTNNESDNAMEICEINEDIRKNDKQNETEIEVSTKKEEVKSKKALITDYFKSK